MSQPPALILAAGRGERMRPLTDACPKPLLGVRGKPLIEWHLEALAAAGVTQVVINTAWLEEQFPAALGDGARWGLSIRYSTEGRDHGGALETAGGIAKALPWLAQHEDAAFWVVSGDVFLPGFEFRAEAAADFAASGERARLWLVANAPHHPQGDFGIDAATGLATRQVPRRTWASVGLFRASMFAGIAPGTRLALRPLLDAALDAGRLGARTWDGRWTDVGTAERLHALNADGLPMRVLETPRLRLEPQTAAHAEAMFAVLCDPALYAYENAAPVSVQALRARFTKLETRRSGDGSEQWLNWVLRPPGGAPIGYVQATVQADGSALVAYVLASAAWGRGLASEAVEAMLGELAAQYGVRSLWAVFKRPNLRSRRLLERLQFHAASTEDAQRLGVEADEDLLGRRIQDAGAA
jgi:N-acetyl-alpha-D-muramate 1-phosphate uridylyltransferase